MTQKSTRVNTPKQTLGPPTRKEVKQINSWMELEKNELGVVLPSGRIWPYVLINTLDVETINDAEQILDDIDANRNLPLSRLQPQGPSAPSIVSRQMTPFAFVSKKANAPVVSWLALSHTRNLLRIHKRNLADKQVMSQRFPPQRPEPDPNVVRMEFEEMFGSLSQPGKYDEFARIRNHNGEFVDVTKVEKFMSSYTLFISTAAFVTLQEISPEAIKELADKAGNFKYEAFSTPDNGRGQAVGIIVHKYHKVLEHGSWSDVANVGGIKHLREAPWIRTKNVRLSSCHLKSNIGGRRATEKVRTEQVNKWLDHMDATYREGDIQIITGDFNCLVDMDPPPPELARFYHDGWKRLGANNHEPTHISRRAIDAIFYRGPAEITDYVIYHIWQTNLSDHDAVEGRIPQLRPKAIRQRKTKSQNKVKRDSCDCKTEEKPKVSRKRKKKTEVVQIRLKPIRKD